MTLQQHGLTVPSPLATTGDIIAYSGTAREINVSEEAFEAASTGITQWTQPCCELVSGTTVRIYGGSGHAVYNTDADENNWTYSSVSWATQTYDVGSSPTNEVYWVYYDVSAGALASQTTEPTATQRITDIYLARVVVRSSTAVAVVPDGNYVIAPSARLESLFRTIGLMNKGVVFDGNASLTMSRSAGTLIDITGGLPTDVNSPDDVPISAANPVTFQHVTQTAATGSNVTSIDPGNYDSAGTITAISGASTRATNMRIYQFPSGNVRVAYGQFIYNKLTDAIIGASTEAYVENPDIAGNGLLVATLSVIKGATDLSDETQARFLPAGIFGEQAVGGSGQSVTDLQRSYDNSAAGLILTDSTRAAVQLQRGSGADTDDVFEILNGAGSSVLSVTGGGTLDLTGQLNADSLRLDGTTLSTTSGNLTLDAAGGTVTTPDILSVTNVTASNSTSTGALTVAGGVGVAGALYASDVTVADGGSVEIGSSGTGSPNSAALKISGNYGGSSVGSNTTTMLSWNRSNGGGETEFIFRTGAGSSPRLSLTGWNGTTATEYASLSTTRLDLVSSVDLKVNNTTASTSTSTGCATFAGGVGIAGSCYVGGTLSFGTHTAIGAETVTGYITIIDAGGTSRKLAVVS